MSSWDKLLERIINLSNDMRFDELRKVLESYGYTMNVEEYMSKPYKLEIIPDVIEGGFVVSYPELKGCLTTGETIQDAIANAE